MPQAPDIPPLPSFLIIGARRCGTRWLRFNLDKHPEIYAPPKELNFFNDPERMASWKMTGYRRKFEGWDGEPITGEASPAYMLLGDKPVETCARIRKQVPEVRLIAILRNPIDRLESALRHYIKTGQIKPDKELQAYLADNVELLDELSVATGGLYAQSLRIYLTTFGEQVKVVLFDDLVADPAGVYRDVLEHLGASPDFVPRDIERPMFSTAQSVRLEGVPFSDRTRREVYRWYRRDVERLEEMIGRDLSHWNPGRPLPPEQ